MYSRAISELFLSEIGIVSRRIDNAACTLYNFFFPPPTNEAGPQGKQAVRQRC